MLIYRVWRRRFIVHLICFFLQTLFVSAGTEQSTNVSVPTIYKTVRRQDSKTFLTDTSNVPDSVLNDFAGTAILDDPIETNFKIDAMRSNKTMNKTISSERKSIRMTLRRVRRAA